MQQITGINHITFAVRDLDISFNFYKDILGAVPVARWYKGAYLRAGALWIALNLDPYAKTEPPPDYTHIAFTVPASEFAEIAARIESSGATIWQGNRSEGASLYFLDPDHHKLEIHSSDLAARLQSLRERPPAELVLYTQAGESL